MRPVRCWAFLSSLSVGWILLNVGTVAQPNAPTAPPGERALTKQELVELYSGKSWQWSDGIGYFSPKGQFGAFAGSGPDRTTVKGDWEAFNTGRLCFSGVWTGRSGRRFARTCFLHRVKDGLIYQRRIPDGEWYVFRHNPEQDGDQKLVPGDRTAK